MGDGLFIVLRVGCVGLFVSGWIVLYLYLH